jgi:hypothetical protein
MAKKKDQSSEEHTLQQKTKPKQQIQQIQPKLKQIQRENQNPDPKKKIDQIKPRKASEIFP